MMAARESAVRRRRRKRRRGGEEGEGGGEGGDGEDDPGEEPQKVCSVITLSSSPYWCLLPILGRSKHQSVQLFFGVSNIFLDFSEKRREPESVLGARLKTLNPRRHFNLGVGFYNNSHFMFSCVCHIVLFPQSNLTWSGCIWMFRQSS